MIRLEMLLRLLLIFLLLPPTVVAAADDATTATTTTSALTGTSFDHFCRGTKCAHTHTDTQADTMSEFLQK